MNQFSGQTYANIIYISCHIYLLKACLDITALIAIMKTIQRSLLRFRGPGTKELDLTTPVAQILKNI